MQHPLAGWMPVLINESTYTQATVDILTDKAIETRSLMLWAGVYGFWIVVGLGVLLAALGFFRATRA
ncbi:MAG: hypothetical protein IZT57_04025, partial [Chloroflexi bacterium]|nr:hypothetical protein [Chloroflexota bacterium]